MSDKSFSAIMEMLKDPEFLNEKKCDLYFSTGYSFVILQKLYVGFAVANDLGVFDVPHASEDDKRVERQGHVSSQRESIFIIA